MCIELYSLNQQIQIPFEQEIVHFHSPFEFVGTYTMLIRNSGYDDIDELVCLFPRLISSGCYNNVSKKLKFDLKECLGNTTSKETILKSFGERFEIQPNHNEPDEITVVIPDPNNPASTLPGITGYCYPANAKIFLPEQLRGQTTRALKIAEECRVTLWGLKLKKPIKKDTAHWYQFTITINLSPNETNFLHDSLIGPCIYYEFASPIDVRRTVAEQILVSKQILKRLDAPQGVSACDALVEGFGLDKKRMVDIQYYELNINTGDPSDQMMINCLSQGDIRFRSASPKIVTYDDKAKGTKYQMPVFEWKSGTILEPPHPWKDTGFSIRLCLNFNKSIITPKSLATTKTPLPAL